MKHFFTLVFLAALLIGGMESPASAQQTPTNTKCNDESALSWTMNTELDIGHYNVYASNNPIDVTVDNTALLLMSVPHPVTGSDVTHPLNSQLAEGDKYFRVTAVDTPANNESPMSLEVGCNYNLIPSAPGNVNIILKHTPPSPAP